MNVVVVLRTSFRPRVAAGEVRHECDSSQASHRRSHPRRQRFNLRPDAAVAPREFRFPERHISSWLPKVGHRRLYEEHFALSEGGYCSRLLYFQVSERPCDARFA
jgi:hypothetical protein